MSTITNYTKRLKKKITQKEVYKNISKQTFVGLCGPNVIQYLNKIDYKRFRRITLYEENYYIYRRIVQTLGCDYPTVKILNKNINNHLGRIKAFYDLDYCKTLLDTRKFLDKISKIEEFSITFCLRNCSVQTTLRIFSSHLKHQHFRHWIYRDGSPMITILVSKKLF